MFDSAQTVCGCGGLMHEPAFPRRGLPDTTMNTPSNVDLGSPPQRSVTQIIIGCVVLAILISGGASIIANYMLNLIGPR